MIKLIMTKGLPASGKSTWAKDQVEKSGGKTKRINKDDLRSMIDSGIWSKANEKEILKVRDDLIEHFLYKGYSVIVDDTNLAPKHEVVLKDIADVWKADFEVKEFIVDVDECIKRDLKRPASVGEKVIRDMYNQFLAPKPEVYKPASSLPGAIICDLDGTLALHTSGRSPFHWSRVGEDSVNESVLNYICTQNELYGTNIIFVSGRDSVCRPETEKWLKDNLGDSFKYALFMRPEKDHRPDTEVKKEIFDNYIRDKYNVELVLDDRPSVIRMWVELGLNVWAVGGGQKEF